MTIKNKKDTKKVKIIFYLYIINPTNFLDKFLLNNNM